jgi:hypothetical protein
MAVDSDRRWPVVPFHTAAFDERGVVIAAAPAPYRET